MGWQVWSSKVHDADHSFQDSSISMRNSLEQATSLEHFISAMLSSVLEANAELASSHQATIAAIGQETDRALGLLLPALVAAANMSITLEQKMVRNSFPCGLATSRTPRLISSACRRGLSVFR